MLKSKTWVIVLFGAAALLPAPPVHASELVKLAKLLVTGKRAPAASEAPKAQAGAPAARAEATVAPGERWTPVRSTEGAPAERGATATPRADAQDAPVVPPTTDWQGQDRGEPTAVPKAPPADANPSRGDRFEAAGSGGHRPPARG